MNILDITVENLSNFTMSKFMFHLRFSREEDYSHKHELYEILRSRNLYQVQFDLKKKLQKRIRAIELAEKVHTATFQSRKALFLQDVQEKIKKRNRHTENYTTTEEENVSDRIPPPHETQPIFFNAEEYRSHTAPEMLRRPDEQISNSDLENEDDAVITTRRSLTFCGKTFPLSKSASKSRNRGTIKLENVTEETDSVLNDVIDTSDKDYANKLPSISNGHTDLGDKNVAFSSDATEKRKFVTTLSAPDLSKLSVFESGVTTPDGRLILNREDYDSYMEKFRLATKQRLVRQRRKSETLSEQVRKFRIHDHSEEGGIQHPVSTEETDEPQ